MSRREERGEVVDDTLHPLEKPLKLYVIGVGLSLPLFLLIFHLFMDEPHPIGYLIGVVIVVVPFGILIQFAKTLMGKDHFVVYEKGVEGYFESVEPGDYSGPIRDMPDKPSSMLMFVPFERFSEIRPIYESYGGLKKFGLQVDATDNEMNIIICEVKGPIEIGKTVRALKRATGSRWNQLFRPDRPVLYPLDADIHEFNGEWGKMMMGGV